ncbi:MAG: hypothetical protein N3G20_12355 [Verrucomicrobiae bacterium]|nr:hypothetical protein [Verrucomicrobiae bacterium]
MLRFAARAGEKENPEAICLLRNVESVRVKIIGLTDANRQHVQEQTEKICHELESRGWERSVISETRPAKTSKYTPDPMDLKHWQGLLLSWFTRLKHCW